MSIQDEVNKVLGTASLTAGAINALTDKNIELNTELNEELAGNLKNNEKSAESLSEKVKDWEASLQDPNKSPEQIKNTSELIDVSKELINYNAKAKQELDLRMKNLKSARSIIDKYKTNRDLSKARTSIKETGNEILSRAKNIEERGGF